MAKVSYSSNAFANIERIFEGLSERAPDAAKNAVVAIKGAISMLEHHPLIGRIATDGLRELVISYGRTGYVALYQHSVEHEEVWVLAVRHQRELDYP